MAETLSTQEKAHEALNEYVSRIVSEKGTTADAVIPILHAIQNKYNFLPQSALQRVCEITDITPAAIAGVASFYSQFRSTPVGDHIIQVCSGTACHVKGAELVLDAFYRELKIPQDKDTDPKGQFTVNRVACLGCCTLAPVVQIDTVTYGHVTPTGVAQIIHDFKTMPHIQSEDKFSHKEFKDELGEIRIGLGSCCVASGSAKVQVALEKALTDSGVHTNVKRVGCVGMCHRVPLLEVIPPNKDAVLYENVQPEEVKKLVLRHFKPVNWRKD